MPKIGTPIEQQDAATRLAYQADEVLALLRDWPAEALTVGELIWLVNLSAVSFDAAKVEQLEAAAQSLLKKAGLE